MQKRSSKDNFGEVANCSEISSWENGTNWLDSIWNICSNVTSEKCLIKCPEENGPILLWGSCWKFLCGEHRRMVVPQLAHSIKEPFLWRTMRAIQKMLLSMITNITRFWMRKADQKPYLNWNWRPRILLISPLKNSTLFYSIEYFPTPYEHLKRVGIDHTFTCFLQWKGLNTYPHIYI